MSQAETGTDDEEFPCPYCSEEFDNGHEKTDHLTDDHDAFTLVAKGDLAPLVRWRARQSAK